MLEKIGDVLLVILMLATMFFGLILVISAFISFYLRG